MDTLVYGYGKHWIRHLEGLISESGYGTARIALTAESLGRSLESALPDLMFVVHEPPFLDAIDLGAITGKGYCIPSVFVSNNIDSLLAARAASAGYASLLAVPAVSSAIHGAIATAMKQGLALSEISARLEVLERKLSERKVIEKAKGLLMEKEQISEDAAFRAIRSRSMARRVSMARLAEELIRKSDRQDLP